MAMGQYHKIAIVGRPNVGKSSLFNRIVGKRVAIVNEEEGVTRDRLYHSIDIFGTPFELIDTGGLDNSGAHPFAKEVNAQVRSAISEATHIILVVDGKVGLLQEDIMVAKELRKLGKSIFLAVNKVDDLESDDLLTPFYKLGFDQMFGVSAAHAVNVAELLLAIKEKTEGLEEIEAAKDSDVRVAIIGRPNVGKSTLLNHLLQSERVVVSPVAGTTRDSIDEEVEYEGKKVVFIDTAGIRRKKSEKEVIDKFAFMRTERAIRSASICILVVDVRDGITSEEKKMLSMIEELGKGCIILLNKWDLCPGFRMEHAIKALGDEVPFTKILPKIIGSALTGRNIPVLFEHIFAIKGELEKKITTGQLNSFIRACFEKLAPPMLRGKRLRVYYATQIGSTPPKFVLFVNNKEFLATSYERFLTNEFRKMFGFVGVPLTFFFRGKKKRQKGGGAPNKTGLIAEAGSTIKIRPEDLVFESEDASEKDPAGV
jgi:GTPase